MAAHRPRRTVLGPKRAEMSPETWCPRLPLRHKAAATRTRAQPRRFADERGVPERLEGCLLAMPRLDSKPSVRLSDFAIAFGRSGRSSRGFLSRKTTPRQLKMGHVIAKSL